MEAINARNLILVSLALSAVLLDLTFKSSLPHSMCASTQWEHSSLLLSHIVCLVRIFTFQALGQEIRCKYFVLFCSCTARVEDKIGVLKRNFTNPLHLYPGCSLSFWMCCAGPTLDPAGAYFRIFFFFCWYKQTTIMVLLLLFLCVCVCRLSGPGWTMGENSWNPAG